MKIKKNLLILIGIAIATIIFTKIMLLIISSHCKFIKLSSNVVGGFIWVVILILLAWAVKILNEYSKKNRIFLLTMLIIMMLVIFLKKIYLIEVVSLIIVEWIVTIFISLFLNFYLRLENKLFKKIDDYLEKRNKKLISKGVFAYFCNYNWENGKLLSILSYYDKQDLYRNVEELLIKNHQIEPYIFYYNMVDEFIKLPLDELIKIKYFLDEDKNGNKMRISNILPKIISNIKLSTSAIPLFFGISITNNIRLDNLKKISLNEWLLVMIIYIIAILGILFIMNYINDKKNIRSTKMLENIINAAIEKKKLEIK